jgi:hypothetical protein
LRARVMWEKNERRSSRRVPTHFERVAACAASSSDTHCANSSLHRASPLPPPCRPPLPLLAAALAAATAPT